MRTFTSLFAFASLTVLASAVYAQGQAQGYDRWPGMMGWGCGMGWPWPIMMFVFWIAMVGGFVFIARRLTSAQRGRGGASDESALDILKKRYAKGEVGKDEFEKIKKDIS